MQKRQTMKEQKPDFDNQVHTIEEPTDYEDEKLNPLIITEHSLDQALELTGNGKFQIIALFISGISIMSVLTEGHCMAYVLPAAKCELNMSTAEQGFLKSIALLGVTLGSHFWGFLADTWGRQKVLRTALFLAFMLSLLSSLSFNRYMLMLTRFGSGLCMAGVKGIAVTFLGEFMSNKNRPRYLALVVSFTTLGLTLQPLIGMFVLTRSFEWHFFNGLLVFRPWRMFIVINSMISGLAFFGMTLLPESPKFQLAMDRPKEALNITRKMFAWNTGQPEEKFSVQNIAMLEVRGTNLSEVNGIKATLLLAWNQTMPLFYSPYLTNMLLMCGSTFALYFVVHGQEFWYPQILSYYSKNVDLPITICEAISLGHTAELLSITNTTKMLNSTIPANLESCDIILDPLTFKVSIAMGIFCWMCNILLAFGINRFGTKSILTGWFAVNTISALAVIWTNEFYLNILLMTLIISSYICCNIVVGIMGDIFPTHLRAMALNLMLMFGRLGSVLGINFVAAMIFGFCDELYGIHFLIVLGAVSVIYRMMWK